MFDRVISLVGEDKFKKIKEISVLVVGLGGVGGYAVESLIRSGIHNIILMDYDKIDKTNLNRQIVTDTSNIGKLKTEEFKKRIASINPECKVTLLNIFLDINNINMLDEYKIDYIVDACDTGAAKKLLIDYATEKNIKIISCMGTAKKLDPSKLKITDIRNTSYDPLAKIIRKYVKEKHINKKIMVVSSDERPQENKDLASLIFVPAVAGMMCANYIINDIK